ncbi:MAG: hypothetical protein ABJE10_22350 [bacterium]
MVVLTSNANALTPCDSHNFNGGWINVYANTTGGQVYLGQVQADLNTLDFDNVPNAASVTLYAFPDNIKRCTFDSFEGNAPGGPTSLTTSASGALPTAFFQCP